MPDSCERLFSINSLLKDPFRKKIFSIFEGGISRMLSLSEKGRSTKSSQMAADSLEAGLVPGGGPVIVVANHPFGAAEGIVLASILKRARGDFKIMANHLLSPAKELRDSLILVDPFGGKESVRTNIRPLREAIGWVKGGGALAVFPAGEVSSLNFRNNEVTDPEWSDTVARLIRNTGAPALPVFFSGSNSALFHLLGLIHPR